MRLLEHVIDLRNGLVVRMRLHRVGAKGGKADRREVVARDIVQTSSPFGSSLRTQPDVKAGVLSSKVLARGLWYERVGEVKEALVLQAVSRSLASVNVPTHGHGSVAELCQRQSILIMVMYILCCGAVDGCWRRSYLLGLWRPWRLGM